MSRVVLCKDGERFWYLVVGNAKMPSTSAYVFTIDKNSGWIYHTGLQGIDLFETVETAVQFVSQSLVASEWIDLGTALIGATRHGKKLVLAFVKKDENVGFVFGHPIKRILEVGYEVLLVQKAVAGQADTEFWTEFPMDRNHFYCESVNLSDPFPYRERSHYEQSFCWNNRWLIPFRACSALSACAVVLQGVAVSMVPEPDAESNVTYIIKRSVASPGTRYNARGMNETYAPGNECECELIMDHGGESIAVAWRRGSSPLYWKTVVSSPVAVPKHVVEDMANQWTATYFGGLMTRFDGLSKICVLSLLHDQPDDAERVLVDAYKEGVDMASKDIDLPVVFNNYDLNRRLRRDKTEAMREMLDIMVSDVDDGGWVTCDNSMNVRESQNKLFRFNCADSLDRTNLATFYYALLIVAKFARNCSVFKRDGAEDWTDPITFLDQSVIDFLCSAFIDSGNVVALLYTNTSALKLSHITRFMSNQSRMWTNPDMSVSVMRRFYNIFTDPQREQILQEWTAETIVQDSSFVLDGSHISVFSGKHDSGRAIIGHGIVDEIPRAFQCGGSVDTDITFMFSETLCVTAISLYIIPQDTSKRVYLSIFGGTDAYSMHPVVQEMMLPIMDKAQWLCYDLEQLAAKSNQIPVDFRSLVAVRFVSLWFHCNSESFFVGNVKFEVGYARRTNPSYEIDPMAKTSGNIKDFVRHISGDNILTACELRSLELARVVIGVTDGERNHACMSHGKNPFMYDAQSRMIQENAKKCPSCKGNLTESAKEKNRFVMSSEYRKLAIPTKRDLIILCDKCAKDMENAPHPEDFLAEVRSAPHIVRVDNGISVTVSRQMNYIHGVISLSHLSACWSYPEGLLARSVQSILSVDGGDLTVPLTKPAVFIVAFPSRVELESIEVDLLEPADFQLSLAAAGCHEYILDDALQHKKTCSITGWAPVPAIVMTLTARSGTSCKIRHISIRGVPCGSVSDVQPAQNPLISSLPRFVAASSTWNSDTRTQSMRHNGRAINGIMLQTVSSPTRASSLLVAFYASGDLLTSLSVILPDVTDATTFAFPISVPRNTCDNILVFYLDRVPSVTSHKLMIY